MKSSDPKGFFPSKKMAQHWKGIKNRLGEKMKARKTRESSGAMEETAASPAARKPNRIISFPVALFLVVSFLVIRSAGCRHEAPAGPPSPEVAVVTVQPERVAITTELPGRTSAFLVAEIRPQVSGLIQKRLFTEGADVRAGEVLYQIDPAPYQAALDNAAASLARAQAGLESIRLRAERYRELLRDNAVSQQDYDDAAAALKQAEAETEFWKASVQTARINLDYTGVKSPISGRIGKSNVTDGAIVTAYQPLSLATVQQFDPLYVDVPQSATDRLRFQRRLEDGRLASDPKNQSKVGLILADGTPYPLEGTLQFKDVTVDPATGSVILRAVFPNPRGDLLPGLFVRAVIEEGVNEQAILVPQQGVARTPKGEPYAFVAAPDNTVQQRMLTIDRAVGNRWLVSSGLNAGDRVIVEGLLKIRPGAPVRAVAFQPPVSASPNQATGDSR
jgi:membrane fusion protein (multidrug efflux system)